MVLRGVVLMGSDDLLQGLVCVGPHLHRAALALLGAVPVVRPVFGEGKPVHH